MVREEKPNDVVDDVGRRGDTETPVDGRNSLLTNREYSGSETECV